MDWQPGLGPKANSQRALERVSDRKSKRYAECHLAVAILCNLPQLQLPCFHGSGKDQLPKLLPFYTETGRQLLYSSFLELERSAQLHAWSS